MAKRNINGGSGYKTMTGGVNRITQKGNAGVGKGSFGDALNNGYIPKLAMNADGTSQTVRAVSGGKTKVVSGSAKS